MDVKIGVQTWEPDAPQEKIIVEKVSRLFKLTQSPLVGQIVFLFWSRIRHYGRNVGLNQFDGLRVGNSLDLNL